MTSYFRDVMTAGAVALALVPAGALRAQTVSAVPSAIQVPEGNIAYLKSSATGTQNYTCVPSVSGYVWKFTGPQATVFVTLKWLNSEIRQQIATHYLSPNPSEGGMARVTWQGSLDTSAVWGSAIASSSDPAFVAPGAVPWLLVQIVGAQRGPTGGDALAGTTYIQRINTSGGVAPQLPCSESANAGVTMFQAYTAEYVFYKAGRRN
jgi:hypothetical protein